MKKLLLLSIVLLLLAGCGPSKRELEEREALKKVQSMQTEDSLVENFAGEPGSLLISPSTQLLKPDGGGAGTIRYVGLGGHTYIQWYSDNGAAMCHDENCGNEKHTLVTN